MLPHQVVSQDLHELLPHFLVVRDLEAALLLRPLARGLEAVGGLHTKFAEHHRARRGLLMFLRGEAIVLARFIVVALKQVLTCKSPSKNG